MTAQRARHIAILVALAIVATLFALWTVPVPTDPSPTSATPTTEPARPATTLSVHRPTAPAEEAPTPVAAPAARQAPVITLPDEPPATIDTVARVFVRVVDAAGQPIRDVEVSHRGECGGGEFSWPTGRGELVLLPGDCTLRALRKDGAFVTYSQPVDLLLAGGDVIDVPLLLPSERTGGIGVQIRRHRLGMRVIRVVPGSPAEAAGLSAGDIITEVDGVPATELSSEDFVATMTGPEGSEVDFVVEYSGDDGPIAEPVVVTRSFVEG